MSGVTRVDGSPTCDAVKLTERARLPLRRIPLTLKSDDDQVAFGVLSHC